MTTEYHDRVGTYEERIVVRFNVDGSILQLFGDMYAAKMVLNDQALRLFNSNVILGKRFRTVNIDDAKIRIRRIIKSYLARTGKVMMSLSALSSHAHRVTRDSKGLREVLSMMQEDKLIELKVFPGSRALFITLKQPKADDEEAKKVIEDSVPPHKKYKSPWDMLDRSGFKPEISSNEEVITTQEGSTIVTRDLDDDSEEMTRPPEEFGKNDSQHKDSIEDIPESMPSRNDKE